MSRITAMGCTSTKEGLTVPVTFPNTITGSSTSPSQGEIYRIDGQTRIPARHTNHLPGGANRTERQHQPPRDVTDGSRGTSHSTRNVRADSAAAATRDADQAWQDAQYAWQQYYQLLAAYNEQVDSIRVLKLDKETLRKRNSELCNQTAELHRMKAEEDVIERWRTEGQCVCGRSRVEVERLTAELDNVSQEKSELAAEVELLLTQNTWLEKRTTDISQRHDREVSRLRQEVVDAQARLSHERTISAERYRDKAYEIEQEHQQQLGGLRARMKELENENEVLQPQHEKWEAQHALLCDKVQETHRQENELTHLKKQYSKMEQEYAASLSQKGEIHAERESYKEELSRLREESKQLQEAVSQLTDERDLLASNLSIAATSRETNEMNIQMYKKQLQDLQTRHDNDCSKMWDLQQQLQQQQHQLQQQQQQLQLQQQVARDKDGAVTKTASRRRTSRATSKQQLHDLQQRHDKEIIRLQQEYSDVASERDQALADLCSLTSERDKAVTDLSGLTSERDQALADLSSLTSERDQALADLSSLTSERDQALADLSRTATRHAVATENITLYREQLQRLQTSRDGISALCSELQKVKQEKSQAVASLAELEAHRTDEEKQTTNYQELQQSHTDEISRLRLKLRKLTQEKNQAFASLGELEKHHTDDAKQITSYQRQLQDLQERYNGEIGRLQQKCQEANNDLSRVTHEKEKATTDLANLNKRLDEDTKQMEIYKQQLRDLQQRCNEDVSAVRGELEKVTVEKDQAVTDLVRYKRSHGADLEQVESYKQQLHDLQQSHTDEISRLRSKLQKLAKEKKQAIASLGELEEYHIDDAKQITSYQRQLQDLQGRYDGEIGPLHQKYQEANNDLSRVTHEKEKAIADLASLNERISSDDKQMEIYKQQLRDLQQSFTHEVSTLRSKLQNVTQEKDQAVSSMVQLEANRTDDGKQITSYQRRLQDLQQRYDEETSSMRQEHSATKNFMAQLVQERDQVVADLSGLEQKHESELYQLQIYNQQLSDLKKKMDSEVDRLKQEKQKVNRDLSLVTQEKQKVMADFASLEVRSRADAKQRESYKQQLHDLQQRSGGGSGSHAAIIRRKDEEINKLTMQLSKYMNQRLGEDESALENINSKNRPSKIVEDYTELMTTLWLDAKDQLDDAYPDDESEEGKLRCLSSIVLLAREVAESLLGQYRAYVQQVLSHPLTHLSGGNQDQQTPMGNHQLDEFDEVVLGSDLKSSLTNFLKTCSDGVNSEALTQRLNESMRGVDHISRLLTKVKRQKDDRLAQYTAAMCVIAWRMAIQRPPITLETPNMGGSVDKNLHEVYFSCPKHDSNVISTYVWPMLKQKGKNLAKAKVFVVPKYIYDKGMQQ